MSALKLAGLVTFVRKFLSRATAGTTIVSRPRLPRSVSGTEDLKKPDLKAIYLGYTARYADDTKASCERSRLAFGAKGSTIPDLFAEAVKCLCVTANGRVQYVFSWQGLFREQRR